MCADGDPADAQTERAEQLEKDPQAGAQGRRRTQTTVTHSALSPIFRSFARPRPNELLGVSNGARSRVETTADRRLGIRSRCPSGRDLAIGQDVRLETGVNLRY